MQMPTGPGFMYLKNKDNFEVKSMLQSGKTASRQALEWMEYELWRCPYPKKILKHAYNYGEQKVAGYFVDGLLTVYNDDGTTYTVAYEFLGCHWHFCPKNCCKTSKTVEDGQEDQRRLWKIEQSEEIDRLIVKRSCKWEEERKFWIGKFESEHFCFLNERKISERLILNWIKDDKFFGLVRADVSTPPEVIKEFEHLNFPFIFRKFTVTADMLSETVGRLAKENGKDFPKETRTLTWNAKDIILTTPLIQFYTEIGMKVSNIRWAVQYVPSEPFINFVNKMVDQRIKANSGDKPNKPLGDRAKFCLNSCVGRFG